MNDKTNGDIYMVASKGVLVKNAGVFSAFVFNGGVRRTNAELWGMGGNAPDWQARSNATAPNVFKAPAGARSLSVPKLLSNRIIR